MAVVGIDLGTTRSAVARLDEMGRPQIIPNLDGDLFTHSVVLFESKNNKVVGKVAKQNAVAYPDQVAEFVKNQVGRETAGDKWDFFGESYGPEEVSAIILRRLKEDAEEALGEQVERAVITVPAIFGEAERNATKTAGMIAGLDVIGLLDEPVAAALAYGFGLSKTNGEAQNVMLYDLGGGTFDLTVMRVSGLESLSTILTLGAFTQIGQNIKLSNNSTISKLRKAVSGYVPRHRLDIRHSIFPQFSGTVPVAQDSILILPIGPPNCQPGESSYD